MRRAQMREARRQAARKIVNRQPAARPRPVNRPVSPPRKVMPKAPRAAVSRVARRATRRVVPPARGLATAAGMSAAVAGIYALNTASAHSDIMSEVSILQSSLQDLQSRSAFTEIQADITNLETSLNRGIELLESAREKGYHYQADLEDIAYDAVSEWQHLRPQVEQTMQRYAANASAQLPSLNPQVQRLNGVLRNASAAAPLLRSTQSQVNTLLGEISRLENELEASYAGIENQARQLNNRLTQIHWAMDQLSEAKFELSQDEELVMAVPARWDKEGKDDPEGVLFLTDKRLVFERKEKVATKKVLFITTASELVHEVLIDQVLDGVKSLKAANKGLFGHQDFLQVVFAASQLGEVAFHLDGQDSEDWANLVSRAKAGSLAGEKISGASGLSLKDLTRPITTMDIMALQNELNELQDEMMLKSARDGLARLENDVRGLERKLADVRAKGYQIEKDMEADVAVLAAQWERVKSNAESTISHQTGLLGTQMQALQGKMSQIAGMTGNLAAARPVYMQIKSSLASAQAQADAAEATVLDQYDEYADEVEGLHAHLEWVDWMLQALATASFRLLATESGVAATEAVYEHPTSGAENGILFLTDQRLLWEDRVGDYELKVNVPLQQVLDIKKGTDEQTDNESLIFQLGSQGPAPQARFILGMPVADDWLLMVGRARSGGYAADRAEPISEAELERVRNAPQQCSNCGAAFSAPILRGQTEVTCEYCGVVTRI